MAVRVKITEIHANIILECTGEVCNAFWLTPVVVYTTKETMDEDIDKAIERVKQEAAQEDWLTEIDDEILCDTCAVKHGILQPSEEYDDG